MNDSTNNLETSGFSFGYHSSGGVEGGSASNISIANKVNQIANIMQKVAFVGFVALGIATALGTAPLFALAVGSAGFVGISAFYYSTQYYNYKQICKTAGIVFQNAGQVKKFDVAGAKGTCKALPTEHSADTTLWREDLIKAAEHNIVLSGNYCGGKNFTDLLELVEKQMIAKPNLKVAIIASPRFIGKEHLAKIKELQENYPRNFSLIESPDIWHVSTGIKKSTNHTKCLVIDYGKYFILGGSGVQDTFAQTGLDHLTKEDFRKNKSLEQTQKNFETSRQEKSIPVVPKVQPETYNAEDGFLKYFIPSRFRDMDFVFQSEDDDKGSSGKQVYKQMLLLCYRWEQYNKMLNKVSEDQLNVDQLGVFNDEATPIQDTDSLIVELLKTPIPQWQEVKTRVPNFDNSTKKTSDVSFRIFASGPEQNASQFAKKLEKKIKNAKEQIVINHMYFHPTPAIMNALIVAAKRGVKIKVITTGVFSDGPKSHLIFGPRNKYNYNYLLSSLSKEQRKNVEVYEYEQKNTGNHKKVIVIDDTVIAGSSNLGYKSLVTTSDHELNFFAQSRGFADETLKVCDVDIQYSKKVEDSTLSIAEYFQATMHSIMAPLIG